MAEEINVGEAYPATAEFRVNGALTDPGTVTAAALTPSGVALTQVPAKQGQGVYVANIAVTEPGLWRYWVIGTAPAAGVESDIFRAVGLPSVEARYSSPGEVREALDEDPDDTATAASLPDSTILSAVARADADIDAELSGTYAVPFPAGAIPYLVNRLATDLAAYDATLRHYRGQPLLKDHPVRLRGEQARAMLLRLGAGKAELTDAEGAVADTGGGAAVANPRGSPLWDLASFGLSDPLG